jgi:GntR family transcriptional regulator
VSVDQNNRRIDPSSGIPLYIQLRTILAEEIRGLAPGERIPSEPEITRRFRVSRATVRQAIADLAGEGRIEKRRGAGTFVAYRRSSGWKIQSERGWYDDMTRRGHVVKTNVLFLGQTVAPAWVSEALDLPTESEVIQIDRLRSVDGEMATFVRNYLRRDVCEPVLHADLEHASLYAWLEKNCRLWVSEGTRTIRAVSATKDLSAKLQVPRGAPLLLVEAISQDEKRGPFEAYECWHSAAHAAIVVSIGS